MLYKGKYEIDLQVGDVILYRNEFRLFEPITWLSTIIRAFTKYQYNHAALVAEFDGELKIVEAIKKGVEDRPAKNVLERSYSKIYILQPKNPFDREEFNARIKRALKKGYDYNFTLVAQAWWRLRLFIKKSAKYTGHTEPFADKKFACAELVQWGYKRPNWWMASAKEIAEDVDFYKDKFIEPLK